MPPEPLLEVRDLCIQLLPRRGILRGVSFDIPIGTIAGLSGDSGSGKTTLALALLKLLPPTQFGLSGQVRLRGRDLLGLDERPLQALPRAPIPKHLPDPPLPSYPPLPILRHS